MNCQKVFNFLVDELEKYLKENNLNSMILGISGGIDSTVVAAICHEVSKKTGIPLIGRSLPTKFNKEGEITSADLVGKAFCNDYKKVDIHLAYAAIRTGFNSEEISAEHPEKYPIANGNIQARLRMIYLYNLASIHRGIVMDTDNMTEHYLGYYTIHGDQGDYNPIHCLWKTEVFELAEYLVDYYKNISQVHSNSELILENLNKSKAIKKSLKLKPTAGLGITNNDLEEIGADSYDEVDEILRSYLDYGDKVLCDLYLNYNPETVKKVIGRMKASEFKRKGLPIWPLI